MLPRSFHRGAQYLLIDRPTRGGSEDGHGFSVAMPARRLRPHAGLDVELASLLVGLSGRPFHPTRVTQRQKGWSRVVWDLLQVSAGRTTARRAQGIVGAPRRVGRPFSAEVPSPAHLAPFHEVIQALRPSRRPPKPERPPFVGERAQEDEPEGVSLLLVRTRQQEG